ncbi:MAG TPA: polysulfide reductase NrfD [Peptococcaceae bacterium]|nr:polysulfide reductase NrfD [Peptococcaceae bacterium]
MNDQYSLYIDYRPQKEWSKAPMMLEMSFGAIGGGLFLVSALLGLNTGIILGFLLLVVGKGVFLLADLGKPERFLKVLAKPFKSWISFGAWVFLLFILFGFFYCLPLLTGSGPGSGFLKIFTIILALILITYDGFFLAASKGIEAWNSGLLPILYGISGLTAGTGIGMAMAANEQAQLLQQINAVLLIVLAFLVFSYVNFLRKSTLGAREAAKLLLEDLKGPFWGGLVGAGILLPLLLVGLAALGLTAGSSALMLLAAALEICGVFFLRFVILRAGVYSPVI